MKPFNDNTSLVKLDRTIWVAWDLELSFTTNNILLGGRRNKNSCLILKESLKLKIYGYFPKGIDNRRWLCLALVNGKDKRSNFKLEHSNLDTSSHRMAGKSSRRRFVRGRRWEVKRVFGWEWVGCCLRGTHFRWEVSNWGTGCHIRRSSGTCVATR